MSNVADEDELDEELAELQQEQLDRQMLKGGTVPVGDKVAALPDAVRAERKSPVPRAVAEGTSWPAMPMVPRLTLETAKGKTPARAVEEDDEEEELKRLQAEMAM